MDEASTASTNIVRDVWTARACASRQRLHHPALRLDALTPSERRVEQLAADAMSHKEIAQTLFVTIKTVEVHLSHASRKLEISSRAQLDEALLTPVPSPAPASA